MFRCFMERGLRVPEDIAIAVVGESLFEPEMYPPVARVKERYGAMEEEAVRLLLRRIDDPQRPAERVIVPCSVSEEGGGN